MNKGRVKAMEWHTANTGNHQGLVIDQDGKNIAVSYDKEDAAIIAAAPELLEALKRANEVLMEMGFQVENDQEDFMGDIDRAIAKATGRG